MKKNELSGLGCFGLIVLLIVFIFILPFLIFWCGYIDGYIASVVVGKQLCEGLNILFNTNYFEPDKLPLMTGAIAWIGSFFKGTQRISSLNKDK